MATSRPQRADGLAPSMGAVGSTYDAMVELFWGRMQVDLLNRKTSKDTDKLARPSGPRRRTPPGVTAKA